MENLPVQIIGMVWYKPEHYDAIIRIMTDGNNLPRTFHEWRMQAETGEKRQQRDGKTVVRAFIDPETFPDWCRARGLDINSKARSQFAALIAHQVATGSQTESGLH